MERKMGIERVGMELEVVLRERWSHAQSPLL